MRLGCFGKFNQFELIEKNGFDCAELDFGELAAMTDAQLSEVKRQIRNSVVYMVLTLILLIPIPMVLACILDSKLVIGKGFFRGVFFVPVLTSVVVAGTIFRLMFGELPGSLMNRVLAFFGHEPIKWLFSYGTGYTALLLLAVWRWTGMNIVYFFAGLNNIPTELYEAADIDGAGTLKKFWHITLPQLNSTLVTGFLLAMTGAFVNNYDVVNVMTGGGPFHSTEVAIYTIMTTAFRYSNMGKANAMSTILVIFVAIVGFIQLKVMTRDENYE